MTLIPNSVRRIREGQVTEALDPSFDRVTVCRPLTPAIGRGSLSRIGQSWRTLENSPVDLQRLESVNLALRGWMLGYGFGNC